MYMLTYLACLCRLQEHHRHMQGMTLLYPVTMHLPAAHLAANFSWQLPNSALSPLHVFLQAVSKCADLEDLGSKAAGLKYGAAFPAALRTHIQVILEVGRV